MCENDAKLNKSIKVSFSVNILDNILNNKNTDKIEKNKKRVLELNNFFQNCLYFQ